MVTHLIPCFAALDPSNMQSVAIGWAVHACLITVEPYQPAIERHAMKRIAPVLILFLFAMIAWSVFRHAHGIDMDYMGDDFDGPFGALVGLVLVAVLALVALLVAAALTPVMLPVLIPAAIIWWLVSRRNKSKVVAA